MTPNDEPQPPSSPLRDDSDDETPPEQSEAEAAVQLENAETSLDQPSS